MPTLLDLSNSTHQDLGSPNSLVPGIISYWYRSHIGDLNILINSSYVINGAGDDFSPLLIDIDAAIFKSLYFVKYFQSKALENLNASSIDSILEVSENGATVRRVSRNQIAQMFMSSQRQENEYLNELLNFYKLNTGGTPVSVDGSDYISVPYIPRWRNLNYRIIQ